MANHCARSAPVWFQSAPVGSSQLATVPTPAKSLAPGGPRPARPDIICCAHADLAAHTDNLRQNLARLPPHLAPPLLISSHGPRRPFRASAGLHSRPNRGRILARRQKPPPFARCPPSHLRAAPARRMLRAASGRPIWPDQAGARRVSWRPATAFVVVLASTRRIHHPAAARQYKSW